MSASQRRKGKAGELEFCKRLAEYLGESVTRELGAARDGGPDILLGDGWAVEVKRQEVAQLPAWWDQACRQALAAKRWPALAYRENRQPWRVIVPLEILLVGAWRSLPALDLTATISVRGFAALVGALAAARTALESPVSDAKNSDVS